MPHAAHTEEEVVRLIKSGLTMAELAPASGSSSRRVHRIAKKHGLEIRIAATARRTSDTAIADRALQHFFQSDGRKHFQIDNGIVLIGSDAHYWPGLVSPAHRAFVHFCRNLRPAAVILNGDGFDGASISRWPRIGWDKKPKVADELKACTERMGEIEDAAGTKNLFWPLGNHDARFETYLASHAPEYEHTKGFQLKDHFPLWRACWALWLNQDVVVKHRFKGGIHATHNNTLWAGKTIITGHLHSLKVTPFNDYNGIRWGVDCGTLADPNGPQFEDYTEDGPKNHRSGFVVLTFHKGRLLWPEVVHVEGERVEWRGTVAAA